ncbi:transcription termination factor 5, mitochondrial-like [Trichoplusia ni]|uniref:Transcription termination factor 5, mitochondrial-like n=1 Tax=Trichoplusia ni TaxID=7111 RepID=A0A7E5VGH5_TRINI|nr:transcription termination factor 5, mitochondrial-like [Trichoplusia ni]
MKYDLRFCLFEFILSVSSVTFMSYLPMNTKSYKWISILKRGTRYVQSSAVNIDNKSNVKCLCKFFDISESKAQFLCMKHPVITKLNEEKIQSLVNTSSEIGLSPEILIEEPALFGILPVTLKYRYKVLQECGVKVIAPAMLSTYLTILRQKTIGELKNSGYILPQINVENRLASFMTQWPTSLTTLIYEDIDKSTLYTLRLKIIQRYLELLLDLTNEEFYRGIETYPTIKHRPLQNINETLKILQSQIMMPNQKIKSNLYLIHADPENLKEIIYNIRSLGGIDIKEVIRMHPKLASKNYRTLLEIRKLLEEYGISNEAQRRCYGIFTLSIDTIKERLENAKSVPEFNTFFKHPRFLKMIHHNNTAMKRLSKLYSSNKKCASLNVLSGSASHYEIFEKAPGDRLGKGKDLLFCISQSLGKKFNMSQVRKLIKRHPFWINTPVFQVKYVYEQLSTQFTNEEIYENSPILLYPWKKVKAILNLIDKKQMHNEFTWIHEYFDYSFLSKSQKLSLVLYILEKNHYFSGNGVWLDENKQYQESVQN